jgi:murein DD-endopeptidase MepM/ murein hydrolase activator NlpD
MIKRQKLFYYSEETVSYVEARGFRIRFVFGVVSTVVFLLAAVFVGNIFFGEIFGLDFRNGSRVVAENKILKEQLQKLTSRLTDMAFSMDKLSERDNQLRVAVNLPQVDQDTRGVGTGGTVEETNAGILPKNTSDALAASKQVIEKLEREVAFQQKSYASIYQKAEANKELFSCIPAIKPMSGEVSKNSFGMRVDPFLHVLRMHEGVDIQAPMGSPIFATGDGEVEFAGNSGGGYGIAVEINHGHGYATWYAHLLRPVVHPGQKVKRGTLIAYSGNSGLSTGPHLHYEVRVNGEKVNPVNYIMDHVDYQTIRMQVASLK